MPNPLPRWRGFNLLDLYLYQPGRESIRPADTTGPGGYGGGEGDFRESDFQWISDWGFDFVRLPMDYRFWTHELPSGDWTFRENVLERIDRVINLGQKYGIHISLNFHRAPGYCVAPPADPKSLWSDAATRGKFFSQWQTFASRYAGVSSHALSFDLVNEPPAVGLSGFFAHSGMTRKSHEAVIRGAVQAIRAIDPTRLIIADGLNYGTEPIEELIDLGPSAVAQSCRMYAPFGITHYQAPWVNYSWNKTPQWPGADHFDRSWGHEELAAYFAHWASLTDRGVGVHCGEGGAFRNTPHHVVLAWMHDALAILRSHNIGWALWNFRGDFGPLDSNRPDTPYEPYQGSQLDRQMLNLLRQS